MAKSIINTKEILRLVRIACEVYDLEVSKLSIAIEKGNATESECKNAEVVIRAYLKKQIKKISEDL